MENRSLYSLHRSPGGHQGTVPTLWRIEKLSVPDGNRTLNLRPCVCALSALVILTDPSHGTARHWSLSWTTRILFTYSHICLRNTNFNIIFSSTSFSSCSLFMFPADIFIHFLSSSCTLLILYVLVLPCVQGDLQTAFWIGWLDLLHRVHSQLGTTGNKALPLIYTLHSSPLYTH
jgi:hypothetical protein